MKTRAILFPALLFFFFSCINKDAETGDELNLVNDTMAVSILKEINAFRTDSMLPALVNNTIIEQQALAHSYDMAAKGAISHDGFSARVDKIAAKMTVKSAAENVAYGYSSAKDVVAGWLASPGHRANIRGDYTYSGIGVSKSKDGTYYFTQIFIK